jgi:hypothetical protein
VVELRGDIRDHFDEERPGEGLSGHVDLPADRRLLETLAE